MDEIDRFPGAAHPRQTHRLIGHAGSEATVLESLRSGRMHHAWLVGGIEGIGKATLAYRIARFVLSHRDPAMAARDATDLSVDPQAPVARRIAAGAHPDVFVLRRPFDEKRKVHRTVITVEAAREALHFLNSTSAEGGWRVCIVDTCDDLNEAAANALLKLIEEPPPRCLVLALAHQPGAVMPTIRSRCRRLALQPLGTDEIVAVVRGLGLPWSEAPGEDIARAARFAGGSVRGALRALDADTLALCGLVNEILEALPGLDRGRIAALSALVGGRANEAGLETALGLIEERIHSETMRAAVGEGARLAPLVEVWDTVRDRVREATALNLDRRALVITLFSDLAGAFRAARPS
jgi:DNA polymerase-3 subunit delta'